MMTAQQYREAQAKAMSEADLLAAIRRLAEALSWLTYHTHRSQHSPAGFPDLVLVKGPRLIFAELKKQAPRHKPSPEQERWLAALDVVEDAAYPAVAAYLWRPADLLDGTIEAVLRKGDTPPTGLALLRRTR